MNTHTFHVDGLTLVADVEKHTVKVSGEATLTLREADRLRDLLFTVASVAARDVRIER